MSYPPVLWFVTNNYNDNLALFSLHLFSVPEAYTGLGRRTERVIAGQGVKIAACPLMSEAGVAHGAGIAPHMDIAITVNISINTNTDIKAIESQSLMIVRRLKRRCDPWVDKTLLSQIEVLGSISLTLIYDASPRPVVHKWCIVASMRFSERYHKTLRSDVFSGNKINMNEDTHQIHNVITRVALSRNNNRRDDVWNTSLTSDESYDWCHPCILPIAWPWWFVLWCLHLISAFVIERITVNKKEEYHNAFPSFLKWILSHHVL